MPRITNVPASFTATTELVADEIWQVHDGAVRLSFEDTADAERGIRLVQWQTIQIPAGKIVYYRRDGSSAAVLSREVTG